MGKIYLIDGANYVFRAFYALPILTNSKGMPTNALLGFTQMLIKLLKDEKPDYIAVVFDTEKPTFRDEIFEEYKANRKKPPDELVDQFPRFPDIIKALGVPMVSKDGFEADDLIGTLAKRFSAAGFKIVILSGDKDLFQLVNDDVEVWDTMKEKKYGPKEVEEKIGVSPGLVADVLSLAGDSSDNIPGVDGIGIKTAVSLIRKHGSLDAALNGAKEERSAVARKLQAGADSAMLSRRLVLIDCDVPVEIKIEDLKRQSPDVQKLGDLFREFEFKRLIESLEKNQIQ